MTPNTRILITGASWYIWWFLIQVLKEKGMKHIYCLTSHSTADLQDKEWGVSWVYCDLTERNMVFDVIATIAPEYIFHLAALGAKNSVASNSIEAFFSVNAFGMQNLIDASISTGICKGFINVTTAYIYGPHEYPMNEQSALLPQWNYAISKITGDLYLQEKITKNKFPWISYRLFPVYGPNDSDRIIPLIIEAFLTWKEIILFDIHRKRDFVYIDTVIWALLGFDKMQRIHINSINIWSGESITVYELVHKIAMILWKPVPQNIIFRESPIPNLHWECDNTLFKKHFPSAILLDDGLKRILQN